MSAGRCFEKRVGAIMTNILKEEQQAKNGRGRCRLMYQEDVEQDFPLHLLMEIVDHALNRITYEEDCEEYRHACIGLDEWDAPIPPLSASYRARLEEWRALAPSSPVQPEPMWA